MRPQRRKKSERQQVDLLASLASFHLHSLFDLVESPWLSDSRMTGVCCDGSFMFLPSKRMPPYVQNAMVHGRGLIDFLFLASSRPLCC